MPNFEKIMFYYNQSTGLNVTSKTFDEAVKIVLNNEIFKGVTPLKMVFPETGKVLCFKPELFRTYLEGDITKIDLVQATQCDDLYRNNVAIFTQMTTVDSFSLWMRQDDTMTLVDDDNFVTYPYTKQHFDIAVK